MPLPHWLHELETCPSTNRWAMENLSILNHGDVAFTRRQTAGRGQYGRSWQSPQGVLTATFVMQNFPIARIHLLSLAVGLMVIDSLEMLMPDLDGIPKLKWTNDILIHDRKVAGILCETRSPSSDNPVSTTAIVGIGLNRSVNFAQAGIDTAPIGNPISLHEVSKEIPTEFQLLSVLRDHLTQSTVMKVMMQLECDLKPVDWLNQIRSRDALLGKKIQFEAPNGLIVGISKGINERGELLIQDDQGRGRAVNSGRVLKFY